jgi:hypothetical protein
VDLTVDGRAVPLVDEIATLPKEYLGGRARTIAPNILGM